MLAVLRDRGGSDHLKLPTRHAGLHDVCRIDRPFGGPSAHQCVHLIDHEDDILALLDLVQKFLQPLLKLSTEFCAGHQQSQVQLSHALIAEALWHVSLDDHLRQTLCNRSLPNTRLSDKAGVVLRPTTQNLNYTLDLVGPPDERVKFALSSPFREVHSEFFKGAGLFVFAGLLRSRICLVSYVHFQPLFTVGIALVRDCLAHFLNQTVLVNFHVLENLRGNPSGLL
mmetsp:Transcript_65374/g.108578  ORF Transcript_65374/g.108578 Transcript_65374/m.108578 type:complete len:226 (+) Transcript_65374:1925-2602(+)